MSIPAFAWALEQGVAHDLLPADRLVLIYLADQANGDLMCWPGQPRIEKHTGLKNNTVRAAIRRLTDAQLIRVEAAPGRVPRYHILCPLTPANGTGVYPRKSAQGTPANGTGVPPPEPPQTGIGYPLNQAAEPPQMGSPTPANGHNDPSLPQEYTPKTRAHAREEGKQVLEMGEKQKEDDAPAPVPKAPTIGASTGSSGSYRQPGTSEEPPIDPKMASAMQDVIHGIARSWQNNHPPRAPTMSRNEYIEAITPPPRPKTAHLPEAVLRLARMDLADRAAANTKRQIH